MQGQMRQLASTLFWMVLRFELGIHSYIHEMQNQQDSLRLLLT